MMDATITHKGLNESLTFPIMEEAGTPLFSIDIGKPVLEIWESGELNPRHSDTKSRLETYTIVTQLKGPSAYQDAILLADIIKSRTGNGEELTVELSGEDIPNAYPTSETIVAPAAEQARALELTYAPGRTNVVDVELQLTAVGRVGGSTTQIAQTPTNTFQDGPLQISRETSSVDLSDGFTVTRTVGRPNTSIRSISRELPNYTDHNKAAHDAFDIEFQFVADGPNKATRIKNEIVAPRLGSGGTSLELDFNGLFDLGSFNVVPTGSQSLRVQRIAAQKSIEQLPTVSLRRVQ